MIDMSPSLDKSIRNAEFLERIRTNQLTSPNEFTIEMG